MPRPKKAGWERVTITLSADCINALRLLSAITRAEMGSLADQAMRQGGLFDRLAYAQGKDVPAGKPLEPLRSPIEPRPPKDLKPAPQVAPNPPAEPKPAKVASKREGPGIGDKELFLRIDAAIAAGKIGQAELMREAAPDIAPANYRSSWRDRGWIPEKYAPAVRAVLDRLEAIN